MNDLEMCIGDATRSAQKKYEKMTGGWWLSHGPESFIEHEIAIKIYKMGFFVFPEASPKKILQEEGKTPRGRPAKNLGQRFDIVVWHKTSNEVRAIIEIKRAWDIFTLRIDQKKIKKAMNQQLAKAGYLLVYTLMKGGRQSNSTSESEKTRCRKDSLLKRLSNWADQLHCSLVNHFIDGRGDGTWGWAIGLLRVNKS